MWTCIVCCGLELWVYRASVVPWNLQWRTHRPVGCWVSWESTSQNIRRHPTQGAGCRCNFLQGSSHCLALLSVWSADSLCMVWSMLQNVFAFDTYAGHSDLVISTSDCGVRGPGFESRHGQLCLSYQPLWYTVCAPVLQCLGRLSLLFVGQ